MNKDIFCAACQKVTSHKGEVDGNGEFVFTCEVCGRSLKFSKDTTPEQFNKLLTAHEAVNTGQVSQAEQEAKLKALLGE